MLLPLSRRQLRTVSLGTRTLPRFVMNGKETHVFYSCPSGIPQGFVSAAGPQPNPDTLRFFRHPSGGKGRERKDRNNKTKICLSSHICRGCHEQVKGQDGTINHNDITAPLQFPIVATPLATCSLLRYYSISAQYDASPHGKMSQHINKMYQNYRGSRFVWEY